MKKFINNFKIQRLIKNNKFEEAAKLLNKLESNNELSQESINLYRNLCLEGKVTKLYAQASGLFSKAKYKECREILEEVKRTIIANSEKFGFEKAPLNIFFEIVASELEKNSNISLKEMNPLRRKFQEKAKDTFSNEIGKEYSEILVDTLLMPCICKTFEK